VGESERQNEKKKERYLMQREIGLAMFVGSELSGNCKSNYIPCDTNCT